MLLMLMPIYFPSSKILFINNNIGREIEDSYSHYHLCFNTFCFDGYFRYIMCRAVREKLRAGCVSKQKQTEAFSLPVVHQKVWIYYPGSWHSYLVSKHFYSTHCTDGAVVACLPGTLVFKSSHDSQCFSLE